MSKNVLPEIFIDYVNLSKSRFKDFKITCDNKNLNDYLIITKNKVASKMYYKNNLVLDKSKWEFIKTNTSELLLNPFENVNF